MQAFRRMGPDAGGAPRFIWEARAREAIEDAEGAYVCAERASKIERGAIVAWKMMAASALKLQRWPEGRRRRSLDRAGARAHRADLPAGATQSGDGPPGPADPLFRESLSSTIHGLPTPPTCGSCSTAGTTARSRDWRRRPAADPAGDCPGREGWEDCRSQPDAGRGPVRLGRHRGRAALGSPGRPRPDRMPRRRKQEHDPSHANGLETDWIVSVQSGRCKGGDSTPPPPRVIRFGVACPTSISPSPPRKSGQGNPAGYDALRRRIRVLDVKCRVEPDSFGSVVGVRRDRAVAPAYTRESFLRNVEPATAPPVLHHR